MRSRPTWQEAELALTILQERPSDRRALLLLARLPLADATVLAWVSGVQSPTVIYRSLTRLHDAGLIAGTTPPADRGSSPQHFHLTDLGLAAVALDRNLEVGEMARANRLRRSDIATMLPRLPLIAALYDMLGALAASRPGQPHLLAWQRPWRRQYRRPMAKAPLRITLPAMATLSWGDQVRSYFLLPDLGTFPLALYRTAVDRLAQLQRIEGWSLPRLVIATDAERGRAACQELLANVGRPDFAVPLAAHVCTWGDLHADLERMQDREEPHCVPADQLLRPSPIPPLRARRPASPLPTIVGDDLKGPSRISGAPGKTRHRALSLSPADYHVLNVVACHPFLPFDGLAAVLNAQKDTVRRQRNRLIDEGLLRLVESDEVGADAGLQLAELTRAGLELVAAHRGLSLAVAVREIGFAGGGSGDPVGARTKLLQNFAHTRGVDDLFVSLYRIAHRAAAEGGDDTMLEWQNAGACSRRHLRPDGYGIYRRNGRCFGFFLEYDRGTMNRRDYFRKFSAYYDYAITRRFARDYDGYPPILIVTSDNRAEERIARAAREAAIGSGISLPLLLTCRWRIDDANNADGVLGSVWRIPESDFERRCYWLPKFRLPFLLPDLGERRCPRHF